MKMPFKGFDARKRAQASMDKFLQGIAREGVRAAFAACGAIEHRAHSFELINDETKAVDGFVVGVNLQRLSEVDRAVMLDFLNKIVAMSDIICPPDEP